jgi:uncharacterized protein with HEPN domain
MVDIPLDLTEGISTISRDSSPSGLSASITAGMGLVILCFILILIGLIRRALRRSHFQGMSRKEVQERWEEIERIAKQGRMGAKMAIVEADKLVDAALKSMMLPGENMGERLKAARYKYPKISEVWFAHRLRNQLVHETDFEIGGGQARSALSAFRKALQEIGAL